MEREILFRGKSIHSNEWIEGYFVGDNTLVKTEDMMYDLGYINDSRCHECYPESVGQFSGLTDKNEKKIFEGDIIKETWTFNNASIPISKTGKASNIGVMKYSANGYYSEFRVRYEKLMSVGYDSYIEVIGNIYDNKELLKTKIMITPKQIIELIESLPESEEHIFEDDGEIIVTSEWLCGSFAGRGFSAKTKEDAAQQLIDYLDVCIGHNSIVGRVVDESGWPDLGRVKEYCTVAVDEENEED